MGLDIAAYRRLKVVEYPKFDEYGDLENWDTEWLPGESMEWSEEHFPGRGEGVDSKTVYTWEEEFGFRAGGYGAYNWWRSQLNLFANSDHPSNDFMELINFADNEGVIGPVVSKKLVEDFEKNEEKAKAFSKTLKEGKWWFGQYLNWKKAFKMASDNGAVDFH